jgi:hypothetical protein
MKSLSGAKVAIVTIRMKMVLHITQWLLNEGRGV